MIFPPSIARKIVEGKVTQTRRPYRVRKPYAVGRSYAIQAGKHTWAARIVVRGLWADSLANATFADARKEGFRTSDDLLAHYQGRFGVEELTWVIEFELDREAQPRLLHRDSSRGYTTQRHESMKDEPEAVDEAFMEKFVKEKEIRSALVNRERDLRTRASSLARRLRQGTLSVDRSGVDVSKELDRIEEQLREIEGKRAA